MVWCHEQHSYPASKTECLPTQFPRFVDAFLLENGAGILKDVHGVLEANAVVSAGCSVKLTSDNSQI